MLKESLAARRAVSGKEINLRDQTKNKDALASCNERWVDGNEKIPSYRITCIIYNYACVMHAVIIPSSFVFIGHVGAPLVNKNDTPHYILPAIIIN